MNDYLWALVVLAIYIALYVPTVAWLLSTKEA